MDFWEVVAQQCAELKTAKTVEDVLRILAPERNPYGADRCSADGFFAGGGGDQSVYESLMEAGWRVVWWKASYHYELESPDGSGRITYVEGDIYDARRKRTGGTSDGN